ncbi:MAG TPA: hypothetical protein ENJ09_12610 [Planctomycetes bacterium]|nr:hypothetical protein [Planctomycetota bacterium]
MEDHCGETYGIRARRIGLALAMGATLAALAASAGCGNSAGRGNLAVGTETCMTCHNGSQANDYAGPGLENPHPFQGAALLTCTQCHGGNPNGEDPATAHVPPPPEIGDRAQWQTDPLAYFNRLTLAGIDKFPDYTVNGTTYSALDYLQFIAPGDLRVSQDGRGCGACHASHTMSVAGSLSGSASGILAGGMFSIGADNAVPANQGLHEDTAVDFAFRDLQDTGFNPGSARVGQVGELVELPVYSVRNDPSPDAIHGNPAYDAANLQADILPDGRVVTDSELARLYNEQVAFTCGDCHLGSAGANNRYGDFRSSGCTACHMRYSLSGRSTTGDPNVNRTEPLDPDNIDEPELAHPKRHLIQSIAQTLPSGETVGGIDDYACAGCHQGSNRTVMQYWGIRLDQNQDVRRGNQYPANPVSFKTTNGDTRLFDPAVGNRTFNGRNHNQYILEEDYDGDGRDDTPPDVHYEAGLGCIDCHGSYDLHGGDVASGGEIMSRMEQSVAIRCESCHGTVDQYATTVQGTDWAGNSAQVAVDSRGNRLSHVTRDQNGDYWLRSKLTGALHYIDQTRDVTVDTGRVHPTTGAPLYSPKASYAMGRDDGSSATGLGPQQTGTASAGFSHSDDMSCAACHSSWTNSCVGCHLGGEYNTGNNFSNITGERIVFRQTIADFVYQTPVLFQLGVGVDGKIGPIAANSDMFFQWEDRNNQNSGVFAFSDRNATGANTLSTPTPSMAHNLMMPHSIRGKIASDKEGPRYCSACHLTDEGMASFGTEYRSFLASYTAGDYAALDYALLQQHIGRNTNNALESPIWVHQVAGLGSGLFLFDEDGCPVNPLDTNANRIGCNGVAPASNFDPARVLFDLDRIVLEDGSSTGSNSHPMEDPNGVNPLRAGAANPALSGPLGAGVLQRLTDPDAGIILDSWLNSDGTAKGDAATYLNQP